MATVKLNTREYPDRNSKKIAKVRFRIKNNHFDKSYQCKDITAPISEICRFDGDLNHTGKVYDRQLLIQLQTRMADIIELVNKQDWTDFQALKAEIDALSASNETPVEVHKDAIVYFREYVQRLENFNLITPLSVKAYRSSLAAFERYKAYIGKEIEFDDINKKFFIEFRHYMLNEKNMTDAKRVMDKSERSVANYIIVFKAFLQDCVANGIIEVSPFSKFSSNDRKQFMSFQQPEVVSLTIQELDIIKSLELKPKADKIRNAFILQCYIGCRVGDLIANDFTIKYENDELGRIPYLEFLPSKTSKDRKSLQRVPLTATAYKIYTSGCTKGLPAIANYNRMLRNIFKAAKIEKHAHSHIARKTCESLCYNFQPDAFLSGIHAKGSGAVKRYLADDISTKLKIRCLAFNEKLWRLNDNDEIIYTGEEKKAEEIANTPTEILTLSKMILEEMKRKNATVSEVMTQTVTIDIKSIAEKLAESWNNK